MQDESQAPKRFLNFFSQDVANLILANMSINDVKSVSRVSRGDYACTSSFISTFMTNFWRGERAQTTPPAALKYHYSCAHYYAACSESRKAKALMRFFSMMMVGLAKNYGDRLNQCVTFNREELPEQLRITCKNKHLLLDISDFLLEKFNFSLEFFDRNDTTRAIITHEQIERHCAIQLFQYVVYDFLKLPDLTKISDRFVYGRWLAAENWLTDRNGWELIRISCRVVEGSLVHLISGHSTEKLRPFVLNKLHFLADDRPDIRDASRHEWNIAEIDMRYLESQPAFFPLALEFIQPRIQRIMLENIPPNAVETALETEFAEYKKPAPEQKSNKCCVM